MASSFTALYMIELATFELRNVSMLASALLQVVAFIHSEQEATAVKHGMWNSSRNNE